MAVTCDGKANLAYRFTGLWRSNDHEDVWQQAYASYRHRFPNTTLTYGEFRQLLEMRGLEPVEVGGGADRPHDIRLSIGNE